MINRKFIGYIGLLLILTMVSIWATEVNFYAFKDFRNAVHFLAQWFPPNTTILWPMLQESGVTLAIAFLGSFIGLWIALPLSFLAARKTTPYLSVYYLVRLSLNFLRSIPEIIFGLVFLTMLGPGPFAAVLALILHNIGVLAKIISERIEEAEPGPYEALHALGARGSVASLFGMLPEIFPTVLSQYFYRFEVAIRTSLVLGFVGGGGIGQYLFNHFKTFQYSSVAMDVMIIIVIVIIVDILSVKIQKSVS